MTDPTTLAATTGEMTETRHRPRCTRPGWEVTPSLAVHGITVARCLDCGAVEMRTEGHR